MADLEAAIRAKLDSHELVIKGADNGVLRVLGEADQWKSALTAVLDLHAPLPAGVVNKPYLADCAVCMDVGPGGVRPRRLPVRDRRGDREGARRGGRP